MKAETFTATIALLGNPNCGKTTLFNALTGSNQMVGNWPGVTVERKEGYFTQDALQLRVIDLPGIYSLVAHSEDERVARDYLMGGSADLVLNVIDSTNLERNLYLTMLLRETGTPVVVAMNMWDLALERGVTVDLAALTAQLGVPVLAVSAIRALDVQTLKRTLAKELITHKLSKIPTYELPAIFAEAHAALGGDWKATLALESMEAPEAIAWSEKIEASVGEAPQVLLAEARYRTIGMILKEATASRPRESQLSERIDRLLLNRFLGLPLFLLAMYLVFSITIHFGGAFIDFFDIGVGALLVDGVGHLLTTVGAPLWVHIVLANGVGGGIQTLSTFIPIIFILFLMLSLLEDSGYMARAAFIMDRFMRVLGLPGKAFVPLLVGFGCTVPAIMATRTLEHRRDRVMTVMMAPFMSCGAKMPVYALFAVAFFPTAGQNAVFLLYVVGGVVAIATGLLLKNTLLKGETTRFVMELPPYHVPHPMGVLRHSWFRLKDFLLKAGKLLILVMTLLGTLNSIDSHGHLGIEPGEHSLLASAGLLVAPVFEPMGVERDNWPASVSLFMGVFAKEIVVGTLNALYLQQGGLDTLHQAQPLTLGESLLSALTTTQSNLRHLGAGLLDPLGFSQVSQAADPTQANPVFPLLRKNFSQGPLQAFAFLLFVLLYVPCVSATAAAAKELGASMTFFMVFYTTGLAWTLSTLFYQLTLGHSLLWITLSASALALGIGSLKAYSHRR